jgi:hypothetical protein
MKNHVQQTVIALMGLLALGSLTACNNAKSPDAAAKDIAAADNSAAREVADAQRDAQKDMSTDAYADGDHKIAIQKCETLQGHDQQVCKDQADADHEAANANAKAAKVARTP